jgi:hypothetical protein
MLKTQFRVIDRRTSPARALEELDSSVGELHRRAAAFMIQKVVDYSPVDTGTYISSHNVREGRTSGQATESSHRKPRNQPKSSFADAAVSKMMGQLADVENSRRVVIANDAIHAKFVEYGNSKSFGYAVYSRARLDTVEFIRGMVAGSRT